MFVTRLSTRNFNTPFPPPGQSPGIGTFVEWILQFPDPVGQNSVQMPYPGLSVQCSNDESMAEFRFFNEDMQLV